MRTKNEHMWKLYRMQSPKGKSMFDSNSNGYGNRETFNSSTQHGLKKTIAWTLDGKYNSSSYNQHNLEYKF